MKSYKLRHIPTGLFWLPTHKGGYGPKNNLTPKGKLYSRRQDLPSVHGYTYHYKGEHKNMYPWEWEIVEYTLQETATYPPDK